CPSCGRKVTRANAAFCPACGKEVSKSSAFCPACGASLPKAEQPKEEAGENPYGEA
ncbi:MAG: zinc-ribbon domain-containing protein, partial [Lachnospiraceae bacterium]|nr:zinc-ribbon domain-containing protein [Lachnospiraceae bacterium]